MAALSCREPFSVILQNRFILRPSPEYRPKVISPFHSDWDIALPSVGTLQWVFGSLGFGPFIPGILVSNWGFQKDRSVVHSATRTEERLPSLSQDSVLMDPVKY